MQESITIFLGGFFDASFPMRADTRVGPFYEKVSAVKC